VRPEPPEKRGWLKRAVTRPPFRDEAGRKGWYEWLSRAQPHLVRKLLLELDGWQRWSRPLRIALLSDFHTGSHAGDIPRLRAIVAETQAARPDLVLLGGDFVNMQLLGGGRVPPQVTAALLAPLRAPLGSFAVLGNHDYYYGAAEVQYALEAQGITVLSDETRELRFEEKGFNLAGIPDAKRYPEASRALLAGLSKQRPTIVLAHDPYWFTHMPAGPHLMLSGHTHGGQICFPFIGPLRNATRAPLKWTYGLVSEGGRHLYVTSGLGTSAVPVRWNIPPEIVLLDVNGG
jgi:predicted MPP superfamily phosphohydrolase